MTRSPVRCIAFDVDDTLYLERDYVRSGLRVVGDWLIKGMAITGFSQLAWEIFEAGGRGRIFDDALNRLGIEPKEDLVRELVAVYRNHAPDICLLPDANEAIERLRAEVHLTALTGGPMESQRRKVQALGLSTLLRPVVYSGEWGPEYDKPHTRAFELLQKLTGFTGASCVYVADNPKRDFVGPKQLGWRTIRVRRPDSLHADLGSGSDVDIELHDMSSIADAI